MELTTEIVTVLFFTAMLAGFVDTLAGGGGLITLPALMLAGVPPVQALGTNKLQSSLGTGTATLLLLLKARIRWRHIKPLFIAAFCGSALGSLAVQGIDQSRLEIIIPIVLVAIAIYFVGYKPGKPRGKKLKGKYYARAVIAPIGFYDGMFGPGTGSFFCLAGMMLRNANIVFATATAKPLNFATNIASLGVFAIFGNLLWKTGAVMMCGQIIGAWLGTHFLFKINPNWLRILVILMSLAMLTRYVYYQFQG